MVDPRQGKSVVAGRLVAASLAVSMLLAGGTSCFAGDIPAMGLGASFEALSTGIKAGAKDIGTASSADVAAWGKSAPDKKYQDVENAFKGMGAMPHPAEMVARDGYWDLDMVASESNVVYSAAGFSWKKGDGAAVKSRLVFTQQIVRSANPYVNNAAVFRVKEIEVRVTVLPLQQGDPPAVVLDLQDPSKFKTSYEPGWGVQALKAYSCRSNDSDRILCKVDVTESGPLLPSLKRTLYLGFAREKS